MTTTKKRSAIFGAIFLMATSAIGPGFLTQTAVFTNQMKASLAFAILVAVALDISIQLNVWRVIGVAGVRAQELGNRVLPGLGWFLAALIAIGGVVFNIGNVAGSGLGTDAMLGLDPKIGGTITAAVAIVLFLSKRAGAALDRFLVVLGLVMIAMTVYVAIVGHPPVGQALQNTVMPEHVNWLVITTLLGGTVGGYISYAGATGCWIPATSGRRPWGRSPAVPSPAPCSPRSCVPCCSSRCSAWSPAA